MLKVQAAKGQAHTYRSHTSGGATEHRYMLGKIVGFFAPTDLCDRDGLPASVQAPNVFRGPECHALIQRVPEDLFGGLYAVSSSAVEELSESERKKKEKDLRDEAPGVLDVYFQTMGVERESSGGTQDAPLVMRADGHFPAVVVRPLSSKARAARAAGSSSNGAVAPPKAIVDWTRDNDWIQASSHSHHYNLLSVEQTIERLGKQAATAGMEQTLKVFNVKLDKGDAERGFVFNERNTRVPEPDSYRLTYTLSPLRAGGQSLQATLYIKIEPSLPRDIKLEMAEADKGPAVLGGETKLKLTFLGADGSDVRLTKAVVAEQRDLVRAVLDAQLAIPVEPGESELPRMIVSGNQDYFVSGSISTKELKDQLAIVFKIKVLIEGEGELTAGRDPRPKASFWRSTAGSHDRSHDRTKPRDLPLTVSMLGCTLVKDVGPTRGLCIMFPGNIFMRADGPLKRAKHAHFAWKRYGGPLPEGERLTYLANEQVTKTFTFKVISVCPPPIDVEPLVPPASLASHPPLLPPAFSFTSPTSPAAPAVAAAPASPRLLISSRGKSSVVSGRWSVASGRWSVCQSPLDLTWLDLT